MLFRALIYAVLHRFVEQRGISELRSEFDKTPLYLKKKKTVILASRMQARLLYLNIRIGSMTHDCD